MRQSAPFSAIFLLLALVSGTAHAAGSGDGVSRWALFGQTGWAEADVSSYAIGAWHPLPWRAQWGGTSIRSYAEVTLSRWVADDPAPAESRKFTQLGVAPVLRLQHVRAPRGLFLDVGIGAYLITPIYQHDSKRFGSAYNFGDQIAIGTRLGRTGRHEVSLRLQHFSNGGIKQPNPGENFLQARVLIRFAG
ncbi:MAG: acyloxyacyl hydrolase [Pseudomonadota bacterium]